MYGRFDGLALMKSSLCVYYRPMNSINVPCYTEYTAKCYIIREIKRNEIIFFGEIDVKVFPAYTLSAEVICCAS